MADPTPTEPTPVTETEALRASPLIDDPVHDPIALGSAMPIGTTKVLPIEIAEPVETVAGDPVPDPKTLTGPQQSRVEVLTGKRLQRPDAPEMPKTTVATGPLRPEQTVPEQTTQPVA